MDLFLKYAYNEFVIVNSLLTEVNLKINFPHNGQLSACKVAQRAKGAKDSEDECKLTRLTFCENHCLSACGCTRQLVQ